MKKIVYMMRHGQTLFNARKKIQGWCDSPLTELGRKQADRARQYFIDQGVIFDHAYSSTSERACDTLELITDMKYQRLKGLKEWNFGKFEGESEELNPALPYGTFFAAYGGETELEVRSRVADTLLNIMRAEDHEHVLVVSHGAACAQFARQWEQTSKIGAVRGFKNCCILKFEFAQNEFMLVELINHDFSDLQ